jgi:hypothetical protein
MSIACMKSGCVFPAKAVSIERWILNISVLFFAKFIIEQMALAIPLKTM